MSLIATTKQFLNNLLNKFKKNSNATVLNDGQDVATSFAKQVAESLSQCVKLSDGYLEGECPICLDEPRIEDAVHSKYRCGLCNERKTFCLTYFGNFTQSSQLLVHTCFAETAYYPSLKSKWPAVTQK